jgi:hypothetical protein
MHNCVKACQVWFLEFGTVAIDGAEYTLSLFNGVDYCEVVFIGPASGSFDIAAIITAINDTCDTVEAFSTSNLLQIKLVFDLECDEMDALSLVLGAVNMAVPAWLLKIWQLS